MGKVHGKNSKLLFKEFDLSNYFRNTEIGQEAALGDVTAYGDGAHKFVVGLLDGKISAEGLFDGAADAIDEELSAAFGAATDPLITFGPEGLALGKRTKIAQVKEANYKVASPVTDVVSVSAEFQSEGRLGNALSLHDLTAEIATANGTSQEHSASSADGAVANLHVTARSGSASPTLTVKVQHSTDNFTFTDLMTFTAATAAASERKSVTGTVNRYLRVTWTISGTNPSFTFHVSAARL